MLGRLTCTQRRRKLRLKSRPESTYLFVTVINIEEPQYAKTGNMGLLATLVVTEGAEGRGGAGETGRGFSTKPFSMASCFFSSLIVVDFYTGVLKEIVETCACEEDARSLCRNGSLLRNEGARSGMER